MSKNVTKKPARKPIAITAKVNDVVEGVVAKVRHPEPGILIEIPGNPMAFMPNSTLIGKTPEEKAARRAELIGNAGVTVKVMVMEAKDAGYDPEHPEKQRLIVNEAKPFLMDRAQQHQERVAESAQRAAAKTSAVRAAVAALVVGSVVDGRVVKIAEKDSTKNPGEKFAFGAYVDLGGVSGLLHNREMADPVKEGDAVKVFVISAEMDGDKPRVALSTTKVVEQEQAEELLSFFGAGDRTTGRDIRAANIDGVEGFTMKIGQVATDAFLPACDANVKDTSVLTKGSRVARVVCTGKVFAGKYVQVTREDV
ncbi:MAG: hypothetical protein K2Y32_20500 [Candidatus Obscuribacterales bacterium]|nr:hypothetical protein [Candidatus Obscuribacterales bacterium]